ncbi:MAG TPA: HIT family protein [Thermoplasmata archaeon]|nr:HIT family protein [Thermoplasmata archaeon]
MASPDGGEPSCIFCAIVHGRAPAHRFYEDEETIAFLDLFPFTRGHVLVVPKRHVDRLTDLPEAAYSQFLGAIVRVCRRVERLSRHYNVALNQGSLAGQIVFHLHVHVIPRYGPDNPFAVHPRARLDDQEARAIAGTLSPP